jgi:colicin import membrane protein
MSERRENSVLFSLKELRNIEDGRVKKEKEEADARLESDRAAKAAAERAIRDAEQRKIREEEDRVRRIEEEKEGRVREEQMRLQEAERRARVEGEVRLQEERMRLEVHAKTQQKSPMKAILGVTGVLVIVAGGLGYKMYTDHQAELAVQRGKLADAQAAAQASRAELESRLSSIQKEMDTKLAQAQTDAERAQIRAEANQRRAEVAANNRPTHSHGGGAKNDDKTSVPQLRKVGKKDVSDNPLDGL